MIHILKKISYLEDIKKKSYKSVRKKKNLMEKWGGDNKKYTQMVNKCEQVLNLLRYEENEKARHKITLLSSRTAIIILTIPNTWGQSELSSLLAEM